MEHEKDERRGGEGGGRRARKVRVEPGAKLPSGRRFSMPH